MTCPLGQRDVDRDVVSADPPRPRRTSRRAREDQTSTTRDPAASTVASASRSSAPRIVSRPMIVPGPAFGPLAQRRPEDRRRSPPLVGTHVPKREFLVPGGTPRRPFVPIEREDGRCTPGRVEPVEPGRAAAMISSAAAVTATPAGLRPGGRGSAASRLRRAPAPAPSSRSRTVTAPSSSDSTSTVTHHGVPISSWRQCICSRSRPCRRRRPSCGAAGRP